MKIASSPRSGGDGIEGDLVTKGLEAMDEPPLDGLPRPLVEVVRPAIAIEAVLAGEQVIHTVLLGCAVLKQRGVP